MIENGRVIPLLIAVGQLKMYPLHVFAPYRYAVTTPWFSTWVDIDSYIHEHEQVTVHHPIVWIELEDAIRRVFDFSDPTKCFFYDSGDDPRLWGSFERA